MNRDFINDLFYSKTHLRMLFSFYIIGFVKKITLMISRSIICLQIPTFGHFDQFSGIFSNNPKTHYNRKKAHALDWNFSRDDFG